MFVHLNSSSTKFISQLIRFVRVCIFSSHVDDFNAHNSCLTAKLLKQAYQFKVLILVSKSNIELKVLLRQGLTVPRR